MKSASIPTILFLLLIPACSSFHRASSDEEGLEFGYIPLPSKEMSKRSNTSLEILHRGFGIYIRHCGTCHDHVFPSDLHKEDWHVVTPKMAWNSGISAIEQKVLLKYLIAATSEPNFPSELITNSGEHIPLLPYGSKHE